MKKIIEKLKAFTLIEILVAIVGISLVSAAMAPVITKKVNASKTIVNAAELRTQPYCSKFSKDCPMCYPKECFMCKENCDRTFDTQYGKTSAVLDKKACRCSLCNSGTYTGGKIDDDYVPGNVTGDPYCYSCVLEGKKCTSCMPGYYMLNGKCQVCPAGHMCEGTKEGKPVEPKVCNNGTYQPKTGQSVCLDCPRGSKCPKGPNDEPVINPTSCEPGQYQDSTRQSSCKPCVKGTASDETGRKTSCGDCPAGYIAKEAGCTTCTPCKAGEYQDAAGQTGCKPCAKGYYSSSAGWDKCSACPGGQYASNTGMTSCAACSAGTYASGTGNSSCTQCSAGKHQPNTGKTSCIDCNSGKYQGEMGKTSCDNCPKGKYSGPSGAWSKCSACANGSYTSSVAQSSCAPCSLDGCKTYSTTACSCTTCTAGYKLVNGKCEVCPAGTYSKEGATSCTACSSGEYSSSKSSSCSKCNLSCKTYSKSACKCTECSKGQKLVSGECVACEDGTYRDTEPTTSSSCVACSSKTSHCTKCNKTTGVCTNCASGYVLDSSNKCVLDKIVPKKQADCDAIAGDSTSLCYVEVDSVGYCVTTKNIIKSGSTHKGEAAGNTCMITSQKTACHWTKTSGNKSAYLSNKGAASGACDAYKLANTETFKTPSKDVIKKAFNKSACKMIQVGDKCSNGVGKGWCESDHDTHGFDGECCMGNYFFYGMSDGDMKLYNPSTGNSHVYRNKGVNVRCMLTEGKRAN